MSVFGKSFSVLDISGSGLTAERARMRVIANNIANAQVTETRSGGPYKRQQVEFESILNQSMKSRFSKEADMNGVKIKGITQSKDSPNRVYIPGHPKANKDGFVEMPNVSVSKEMVDLIAASRSYEANTSVVTTYRKMNERALNIIRR
ncbi:MAG: flagellar basal body rod protein FlgC [Candidatus Scalindua sp. AMX11]|nr:MAG: flagellar basal body rod protein FlgC [Candidatus Scalindua sp.]NOG85770.1 flagellar basal body rod protein FlgC [Planctomycetota bacterium]RZV97054.1 MAG: flagellar basal body rod protein FlgC [Candidatus Scalindua sp. SCAELEC01]TDE66332.1 MAG: flagellar basal body rod protein FlgC [Candidatus Scalindua sp. AMX11]GJQ58276.1 MAG: flagellar basal-body rod protein FlgC [Candidatus Scalindua sp.]